MKKKRILYIVSSLIKSGPIVVLQNLISHLDKNKFEVAIVKLMADEPQRSITNQFLEEGIKVYEMGLNKMKIELSPNRVAKKIDKVINDFNPEVIHTHGYQALLCATNIKYKIPVMETLHNISGQDFIMGHGKLIGSYMNHRYLNALKKSSYAIAISDAVQEYYSSIIPSLPIEVIPNGVQDVPADLPTKTELRKEMNLSKDDFIFVVIGSLNDRKDPTAIIKAFKKAFPPISNPNVRLFFLGKGYLEKECKIQIGTDNRIQLLGWKAEPYKYLKLADWSITASHSEGFGLNFIESLIVGCPIISTNIPAFKIFDQLFSDLKEYKFNPGDIETLSKLMRKALEEKVDSLKLIKQADKYYSSRIMAEKYAAVYDQLATK